MSSSSHEKRALKLGLRFLVRATSTLVLLLIFVLSLAAGAVLHLGMSVSRLAAANILEHYLSSTFRGSFEIGEVARLSGGGLSARKLEAYDPQGRLVISINELDADIDPFDIIGRILGDYEKLSIVVHSVFARECELHFFPGEDQSKPGASSAAVSLADTFELVDQGPNTESSGGRPVRVWLEKISLRNVYADGALFDSPKLEARVAAAQASLLASDKGVVVDVKRFDLLASGIGGVDTTAEGEVHARIPGPVFGDVTATFGEIPLRHQFRVENGQIDIQGQYPELRPSSLRPLLGTWPLDRNVSADVHVSGTLPVLQVSAKAQPVNRTGLKQGGVSVEGEIRVDSNDRAKLAVATQSLDLHAWLTTLPVTDLDSQSQVTVSWSGKGPEVSFETELQAGHIARHATPGLRLFGDYKENAWNVDAQMNDLGMAATARVEQNGAQPIGFEARVTKTSLSQSSFLRPLVAPLSAQVEGVVTGTLEGEFLKARVTLDARHVSYLQTSAETAQLTTELQGSLDRLDSFSGQSSLKATNVALSKLSFAHLNLEQSGTFTEPQIKLSAQTKGGASLTGEAVLNLQERVASKLQAELSGRGDPVLASAQRVVFRDDRISVEDFSVQSLGSVQGNFDLTSKSARADIRARGLSISRISRALGLAQGEFEGELSADLNVELGDFSRGSISLEVKNGSVLGFSGLGLSARTNLQGRHVEGKMVATVGAVGAMESHWNAYLAGSSLEEASYSRARGSFFLGTKDVDLKTLTLLFGGAKSLPKLTGTANLDLEFTRDGPDSRKANLELSTKGLQVALPQHDVSTRGIDVQLMLSLPEGKDALESTLRLVDPWGQLLSVSGTLAVPFYDWGNAPPRLDTIISELFASELNAVALVPSRKITRFPLQIAQLASAGTLSARASLGGSLKEPDIRIVVTGKELYGGASPFRQPVTFKTNTRYMTDKNRLLGSIIVEQDDHRLGSAEFATTVDLMNLMSTPEKESAPLWTGQVQVFMESSPLDILHRTSELGLSGTVQGSVLVQRKGLLPELRGEVSLRRLKVEGRELGSGTIEVSTSGNDLVARMEFDDDSGSLFATAETAIQGDRMMFHLDEKRPGRANVRAQRYDSAVLAPMFAGIFEEFEGPLTGEVSAELRPNVAGDKGHDVHLTGDLRLQGGLITPSSLGMRMKDTQAHIIARREGANNVIVLEDIQARVESPVVNVVGRGQLRLKSLSPVDGSFEIRPSNMPVMSDGNHLAQVTGTVLGRLVFEEGQLRAQVTVDDFAAHLPDSSDSNVIDLSENSSIEIVQAPEPEMITEARETFPVHVSLRLGQNVRLKSELMDMRIRGSPEISIEESFQMGGTIELVRGSRFVVLGRNFIIDRGLVMFDTNEALNPHIQAVANWNAPNAVQVRVTVGGTLNAPTLQWSSEPALPGGEADIISLVLGGGGGSDEASVGRTPIAIAANELSDVEGLEFYTTSHAAAGDGRVASLSDASWDSYTAAYQISDELWFEGSYKSGSAGMQSNPRKGVSGTLDWRFHPQWSVRTEIGTLGAGLDLMWQYRY